MQEHPTTASSVCQWAQFYLHQGLSVIPLVRGRAPAVPVKEFQRRRADDQQARDWFDRLHYPGIGLYSGVISDNLEIVDFDRPAAYEEFRDQINPAILAKLVIVKSPGGHHAYYRFRGGSPANAKVTDEAGAEILSIRADGLYAVAPGSERSIYEKVDGGAEYRLMQGRFDQIPVLPRHERESIRQLCLSFGSTRMQDTKLPDISSFEGGVIPPGARHDYLLRAAWMLARRIKHPTSLDFENVLSHLKRLNLLCVDKKGRPAPRPDAELFGMVQSALEKDAVTRDEEIGENGQPAQLISANPSALADLEDEPEPEWFWQGILARGWLSLLVGPAKEAGKTTLFSHLLAAMAAGNPFLGQFTRPDVRALVITEENARDWKKRAELCDLPDSLLLESTPFMGQPTWRQWQHYVNSLAALPSPVDLIVLDPWINLSPAKENDATEVSRALAPLRWLTTQGFAVLLVHHSGRSSSHARGSTAIDGYVDMILTLRRSDPKSPNVRTLEVRGRYSETPDDLHYYLDYQGRIEMTSETKTKTKRQRDVLAAIADVTEEDAKTVKGLADHTNMDRGDCQRILSSLWQEGLVGRSKNGRAFLYFDPYSDPLG